MAFRPRDLADRMARQRKAGDGYLRETFTLPRDAARAKAYQAIGRVKFEGMHYRTDIAEAR